MPEPATTATALGRRFVEALAAKDADALTAVLHPEIDFRAQTPNCVWEAHAPEVLLDIVLGAWFTHEVDVDEVVLVETDAFADRTQVRFRFRGRNADGPMLVEQQAYLTECAGAIDWMRVVCSGQRPSV